MKKKEKVIEKVIEKVKVTYNVAESATEKDVRFGFTTRVFATPL